MSIPLDRLYHYFENLCGDDTIIYHWYPHGSKKLKHLTMIKNYKELSQGEFNLLAPVIFHDQEPLFFDSYTHDEISELQNYKVSTHHLGALSHFQNIIKRMSPIRLALINPFTIYDKLILCHSEKNSMELQKFETHGFVGVYFWSHALIARDWFRYAKHDPALQQYNNDFKYDFLIYNRAWSGTREYRLKFAEMLVDYNLINNCKTSFAAEDSGTNYKQHVFVNNKFKLTNFTLENHFLKNETTSCYSADYDNDDYKQCGIEVVLETLFDDTRNHLTEKSLRPIACKKPFILVSTPFSLQYLRNYGFKTFDGFIDESYDTIIDPKQRLTAVVNELKRISCLSPKDKQELWTKLNSITEYNQRLFFSAHWQNSILEEFKINLENAVIEINKHKTGKYLRELYGHPIMAHKSFQTDTKKSMDQWLSNNGYTY